MLLHAENKSLSEIAQYSPEKLTRDNIADLLAELDAWRAMAAAVDRYAETPEEIAEYIAGLEETAGGCNNADHSEFPDLKEYFEDTVNAMCEISGAWPCASAYDQNLRSAVIECIERGAEIIELERAK